WLSIAAAVATIVLKALAWRNTGSRGLLADALQSVVKLPAALVPLWMLTPPAPPPDQGDAFGDSKAEELSSGFGGPLIPAGAIAIGVSAVERLLAPRALVDVGEGVAISVLASLVNLVVARILLRAGRDERSIALEADGHHLMTDVWTSVGVGVGVAAVAITG